MALRNKIQAQSVQTALEQSCSRKVNNHGLKWNFNRNSTSIPRTQTWNACNSKLIPSSSPVSWHSWILRFWRNQLNPDPIVSDEWNDGSFTRICHTSKFRLWEDQANNLFEIKRWIYMFDSWSFEKSTLKLQIGIAKEPCLICTFRIRCAWF